MIQRKKMPPGILGEILSHKYEFIADCKCRIPLRAMEERAAEAGPVRGFAAALNGEGCSVIAEIKTASPSKGIIRDDVDIVEVARIYEANGASCLSVLTDERFFRGSLDRIPAVRSAVSLPVLRKDFILDPYQIYEARSAGADAVLLIAACLDDDNLGELVECAVLNGMECLLEVHDREEIERAAHFNVPLIGINNRNLTTFDTNIATTGELTPFAPEHATVVSESGINSADDVRRVYDYGARAVLVGEAFMRETDIGAKVREIAHAVEKK